MATEEQLLDDGILSSSANVSWGQKLTISNRYVSKLSFPLIRLGSPGGTLTFLIRKASNDNVIVSKLWGNSNSVPLTKTWLEVTFDTATLINEEVWILLLGSTGSAGNVLQNYAKRSDVKANENAGQRNSSGVYTENPTYDFTYIYTYYVSAAAPSVTTEAVSDIDKTTATGNGTVVSLGVPAATQHGVCWATFENPQIPADNPSCSATEDGVPSSTGAYTSSLTNLKANTKYFLRAYITNNVGTFYGTQVEFWTLPDVPEVTTYLAQNVAATTALGSGNIDNNGGSAITQHGVLWRAGADPDIDTYDGRTELGATTFQFFESLMTNLTVGTEYHYRAYAINADNPSPPGYGSVLKFTTSIAGVPIVKTKATINITPTTATGRGVVTDTGGSAITAYGHCYKAVTDPPTVPTISDSKKETTGVPTIDEVFLSEIADLTAGTSYILAAYATNTQGTAYGDPVNINEVADESKGQIAYQGEHLLYTTKSGKQRRLLGAEF